jgi:uncharacterized integral membrane protein
MVNRFLTIVILVPLAIILIALAVANRGFAPFTIDPFNPGNPALTVSWPLFVYLFIAFAIGLVVGAAATWLKQGRYRKQARRHAEEARGLREEVARARPAPPRPAIPGPSTGPSAGPLH